MELSPLRIGLVIISALLFWYFYRRASGGLKLQELNAISFSFYLLLITSFIGGALIYLGFRNHYVVALVKEGTAKKGFYILAYTLVSLPLLIAMFNRMMGIRNYNGYFTDYIHREMTDIWKTEKAFFVLMVLGTAVCFMAVMYTLYHVGYVALFELLKGHLYLFDSSVSINRNFSGNNYIRNIFAIGLTPILSYLCFVYSHYTKKLRWRVLFWILFVLSVFIKTYDFSKAPVILYFFFFYLIHVLMGSASNMKRIFQYGLLSAFLILGVYYFVLNYSGELLSFTHGPISRLMMSQIAGLFMHVQIFPKSHAFLMGASFPKSLALLFGRGEYGIRSGRVVMSVLWPNAVSENSVGVMNSIFAAEAYANYGTAGVLIAPVIVAFCLSVIPNFILMQRKTPVTISLYVLYTYCYEQALIGGFVDFIYNPVLIIIVFVFIAMAAVSNHWRIPITLRQRKR